MRVGVEMIRRERRVLTLSRRVRVTRGVLSTVFGLALLGLVTSIALDSEVASRLVLSAVVVAALSAAALRFVSDSAIRKEYEIAHARSRAEGALHRRSERLARAQANILELVASGTSPVGIQKAVGKLVAAETDGCWTMGPSGVTSVDPDAPHPPDDLMFLVERMLEVTSERDRIMSALSHQATHDALTGLANRASVLERVSHAMRQRKALVDIAVLFLDLDRFKQVNDSLGHEVGDELLIEVSRRIVEAVREGDTVGRIGGDEFVVVLETITRDQANMVAERMLASITAPLEIGGAPIDIGVSVGIAMPEIGDRDADKLLREADQAMYRAKQNGLDLVEADDELREWSKERREIEHRLREALADEDLTLHYQPLIDTNTRELVGVEALVRLMWGERMLSPGLFLQVAEETGQIADVDGQVLLGAARQVVAWNEASGLNLELSVNVSGAHLARADVFDEIVRALDQSKLPPELLVLEIAETVLLTDAEELARRLDLLRRLGVRVAVDDFGTGYSSLTYLQQLPADILKIDRSFVSRLGLSFGDDAIVKTILDLAAALDLQVVAEGVETEDQLELLRQMGCPFSQGYLFAKPAAASDFAAEWLGADIRNG